MRTSSTFIGDIVLQPGDVLLYHTKGLIPWWIRVKTWSDVNHVEVYIGHSRSFTARETSGVGVFSTRTNGLCYVLRPVRSYDAHHAARWRAAVVGQGYDWLGLMV